MTHQELDFIFPFFVLGYGILMTYVLHSKPLMEIAEKRFPDTLIQQMNGHRTLGLICLVVGALWTLQNVWR